VHTRILLTAGGLNANGRRRYRSWLTKTSSGLGLRLRAPFKRFGRIVKQPRACTKIWQTSNRRYLLWFHNNGTTRYNNGLNAGSRNLAWLSAERHKFSPILKDVSGGRDLRIVPALHGELKHLRLYNRALRTSDAVGNFHALAR